MAECNICRRGSRHLVLVPARGTAFKETYELKQEPRLNDMICHGEFVEIGETGIYEPVDESKVAKHRWVDGGAIVQSL